MFGRNKNSMWASMWVKWESNAFGCKKMLCFSGKFERKNDSRSEWKLIAWNLHLSNWTLEFRFLQKLSNISCEISAQLFLIIFGSHPKAKTQLFELRRKRKSLVYMRILNEPRVVPLASLEFSLLVKFSDNVFFSRLCCALLLHFKRWGKYRLIKKMKFFGLIKLLQYVHALCIFSVRSLPF